MYRKIATQLDPCVISPLSARSCASRNGNAAQFHARFRLFGLAFCVAQTACEKQIVGTPEHRREGIDVAERDQLARGFTNFFPKFTMRRLLRVLDPARCRR